MGCLAGAGFALGATVGYPIGARPPDLLTLLDTSLITRKHVMPLQKRTSDKHHAMSIPSRGSQDRRSAFRKQLCLEPLEDRQMLAVFSVTNLDDSAVDAPGEAPGALRQAVFDANTTPGVDRIEFDSDLSGTITLTSGQIEITESVQLNGPASGLVTISGDNAWRIFEINDGDSDVNQLAEVRRLTLAQGNGASQAFIGGGSAIRSHESLLLEDVMVMDSFSESEGGGIWVDPAIGGSIVIRDSVLAGNRSERSGGAAHLVAPPQGSVIIEDSSFLNNQAIRGGGGATLWASGGSVVQVLNSTFSGNTADNGSGGAIDLDIEQDSTIEIQQATISNNRARMGGGIHVFGSIGAESVLVSHSTITGNATIGASGTINGGGIDLFFVEMALDHSIVAGNEDSEGGAPDVHIRESSVQASFSLVGDNSMSGLTEAPVDAPDASGNLIGDPDGLGVIDARLVPLADAGGRTKVHALLPDSPALDAGDGDYAGTASHDQRSEPFLRVFDGDGASGPRIDIGAYERQDVAAPASLVVDDARDLINGDYSAGNLSLREAVGLANADLDSLQTITFDSALAYQVLTQPFGTLTLTDDAEILGLGMDLLTVAGVGHTGVFQFDDGDASVNSQARVEDIAVTGGHTRQTGVYEPLAAGLDASEEASVRRVHIHDNHTDGARGSLTMSADGATNLLEDSIVANNTTTGLVAGAAINAENGGVARVERTTFRGNVADFGAGGATLLSQSGATLVATQNTFEDNSGANFGGGVIAAAIGGTLTLKDSVINDNRAAAAAGGYLLADAGGELTARNLTIARNDAMDSAPGIFRGGGGVQLEAGANSTLVLEHSAVTGNSTNSVGGGINTVVGGGDITVRQVTVSDNASGRDGGGVHSVALVVGAASIEHSTVTNNRAMTQSADSAEGGGVFSLSGVLDVNHTIVAGNTDDAGDSDAGFDPDGLPGRPGALQITHSLVGVNSGTGLAPAPVGMADAHGNLIGGIGAEAIDPRLGPLAHNGGPTRTHALLPGSPALDAGGAGADGGFDQRGMPYVRIADGDDAASIVIDIGAYEAQATPETVPGDYSGNGVVDTADYTVWRDRLGATGGTPLQGGDGDGDGAVTSVDYAVWRSHFGFEYTALTGDANTASSSTVSGQASEADSRLALTAERARELAFAAPWAGSVAESPRDVEAHISSAWVPDPDDDHRLLLALGSAWSSMHLSADDLSAKEETHDVAIADEDEEESARGALSDALLAAL